MNPPPDRSRKGCLTCKDRRKKCDEQRPQCERCLQGGFECRGYDDTGTYRRAGSDVARPRPKKKALPPDNPFALAVVPYSGERKVPILMPPTIMASTWISRLPPVMPPSASHHLSGEFKPFHAFEVMARNCIRGSAGPFPSLEHPGLAAMSTRIEDSFTLEELFDVYLHFKETSSEKPSKALAKPPAVLPHEDPLHSLVFRSAAFSLASVFFPDDEKSDSASARRRARQYGAVAWEYLSAQLDRKDVSPWIKLGSCVQILLFEIFSPHKFISFHQIMLVARDNIIAATGHASINVRTLSAPGAADLALFAWMDAGSAMMYQQQTLCSYSCYDVDADNGSSQEIALEWRMGCSDLFIWCISRIAFLRGQLATMDQSRFENEAMTLEQYLRSWQPSVPPPMSAEVCQVVRGLQECWRQACIIYLYQELHDAGPLNPVLVRALRDIKQAAAAVPEGEHANLFAGQPFFMAGTISVLEIDRQFVRRRFSGTWLLLLTMLEDVWRRSDQTGYPVHWRIVLNEYSAQMKWTK